MIANSAMATNDELEYYRDLGLSKRLEGPLFDRAIRITKEEAEKDKTKSYGIIKRNEKNDVVHFIKVVNGKFSFHVEYIYGENGALESIKDINKDRNHFGKPIEEYLKEIMSFAVLPKSTAIATSDDVEYYRYVSLSKRLEGPLFDGAFRITKEEAEKDQTKSYGIIKRNERNDVVHFIKVDNGKFSFHVEYIYGKNGALESIKYINNDRNHFDRPIEEYLKDVMPLLENKK